MKKVPIAKPSCAPDTPSLCPPPFPWGSFICHGQKGLIWLSYSYQLIFPWLEYHDNTKEKKRLLRVLVTGFGYTNMPTIIRPGRKLDYVLLCYLALQSWLASVAHSSGAVLFLRVNLNELNSISLSYRGLLKKKTSVDIEIYRLTVGQSSPLVLYFQRFYFSFRSCFKRSISFAHSFAGCSGLTHTQFCHFQIHTSSRGESHLFMRLMPLNLVKLLLFCS